MSVATPTPQGLQPAKESRWERFIDSDLFYAFRTSPVAMLSALVSFLMIGGALVGPYFVPQNPFDPAALNLMDGMTKPGVPNEFTNNVFLFGTDPQGRDMLSAVVYGTRVSLFVGAASVVFSLTFGVLFGLVWFAFFSDT